MGKSLPCVRGCTKLRSPDALETRSTLCPWFDTNVQRTSRGSVGGPGPGGNTTRTPSGPRGAWGTWPWRDDQGRDDDFTIFFVFAFAPDRQSGGFIGHLSVAPTSYLYLVPILPWMKFKTSLINLRTNAYTHFPCHMREELLKKRVCSLQQILKAISDRWMTLHYFLPR